MEAERDTGEESDLGVGGFDEALGEAGVERGVDPSAVGGVPGVAVPTDAGMREPACQLAHRSSATLPASPLTVNA